MEGSVVPAGMGDGNIAAILTDLYQAGYTGFLSLEPHLFHFAGLAALEATGHKTVIKESKTLTGFEAFSLAYDSLIKIVEQIEDRSFASE